MRDFGYLSPLLLWLQNGNFLLLMLGAQTIIIRRRTKEEAQNSHTRRFMDAGLIGMAAEDDDEDEDQLK